ncbi:proton-coupled zinc antiporter SLC30A2-like [Antedon mediterranea]|uniref:proton-coupled zinc antiporter SLC30A2-like n=1 Tax=Antedon mediterranea TaxID=105859 RepID=UPI003AF879AE
MNRTECIVENREMERINEQEQDSTGPPHDSNLRLPPSSFMNGGSSIGLGLQHQHNDGLGLEVSVRGRVKSSPPDPYKNDGYYNRSSFQAGTYSMNSSNRDFFMEDDDEPLLNLSEDNNVHDDYEEEKNHCHSAQEEYSNRGARNQLIIASIICLIFMVGEFVGGYIANSLAIMTDAGHLLSDFASFMISLFALWLANMKPTTKMSFGFYRAEVLGAVLSILIIWVLTGVLLYLAVLRFIHNDFEIDADVMLITAGCGVFLNIVLGCVLHKTGHGHSHGIGQNHGHSHGGEQNHGHGGEQNSHSGGHGHSHGAHGDGHSQKDKHKNINVRAAFIHVIGDFIQSVGVFVAALIIKLADKPNIKLADPICTFFFSILVLITTITILRDAVYLLMEGVPKNISLQNVHDDLQGIENVRTVHSLNVWSLTVNRIATAVHLTVANENLTAEIYQTIQCKASCMLRKKYNIQQITIQVEEYQDDIMSSCKECKGPCS